MAGIMLPSLQGQIATKAQKSSAKNPHPQENFAESFQAQVGKTKEARKNNQPARTAPAEGPKQELDGDAPRKRSAVNASLVLSAPWNMTVRTPVAVLGGRVSDVAAASGSIAHPKTSSLEGGVSSASPSKQDNKKSVQLKTDKTEPIAHLPHRPEVLQPHRPEHAAKVAQPDSVVQPAVVFSALTSGGAIAHTQASPPAQQVAQLIIQTAHQGGGKAEMVLHPESLGTVQIQISFDPKGVMQATITADPQALQALGGDLDKLVHSLESSGIQVGDMQMQARDFNQSNPEAADGQHFGVSVGNSSDDHSVQTIQPVPVSALIQGGLKLDLTI